MTKTGVQEYVKKEMEAPSFCPEAKAACEAYLTAVGTANEKKKAEALVEELKEDVCDIDDCIGFYGTDMANEIYGDQLPAALEAAKKAKAAGEKYCMCPACQAGGKVLDNADAILV